MSIESLKTAIEKQKSALFELEAAVMEMERAPLTESVTIAEAARRIGIHPHTAYRWVKDGNLHVTPTGRVPMVELRRHLDKKNRRGAA